MAAMASAVSGMSVAYDKEGIAPCKRATHYGQRVPVTSFRTGINDDNAQAFARSGLHHDYELWLEELAPHAPIDQAGPEAGCTTTPARPVPRESREQRRRAPETT
ncbi:MAG: hypothetical protein PVG56_15315, partial [Anaerolineae bacterium]